MTKDFKSLSIKLQKDLQGKSKALKQYRAIVKSSKTEYQKYYNENQQLKKKELKNMKIILNNNRNKDKTNSRSNLFNNKKSF